MTSANDLSNSPDLLMSPNISMGDMRGQRYPNQFFDLSQQYMPPTIKELFRWCTFYYYNSPLIGAAMKKVSRYPITDLILEDEHESVRDLWDKVLNKIIKIKDKSMEINLDRHVYGNAFVSIHLPFTRFLICPSCKQRQTIQQWNWQFRGTDFKFSGNCEKCGHTGPLEVKDIPYKDIKGVRLIRWNPENIHLKYNEYTGKYTYMYSIPSKLRNAIMRGDKDIIEDLPMIILEALKSRRMIRFNNDNIFHLKMPTLAEQDQGWGKPSIIHVLKDMYYFYTLRRAQEAIAMEHIVPFDIIYPMPNAQQDPFIHTNLANWRLQTENIIKRHRRDPNFKAVIPIPIGMGRLGGDGKALLLGPELSYVTETVVGGLGLPREFLFGGLSWSGSSISLRTLENDFIQDRSQLLDLTNWIKDKLRIWFSLPNIQSMRYADFRMADDVQKNQQLIGLNAQRKLSDQTTLTELGYDYDQEVKKLIEEVYIQNYINDLISKGSARSQGEAMMITNNYQTKMQELAAKAQQGAQEKMLALQQGEGTPQQGEESFAGPGQSPEWEASGNPPVNAPNVPGGGKAPGGSRKAMTPGGTESEMPSQTPGQMEIEGQIDGMATKLMNSEPTKARMILNDLKAKMPEIGNAVEIRYNQMVGGISEPSAQAQPLPQQKPPRRKK
jgi:hypothetical protein